MDVLIIETSTERGIVAFYRHGERVFFEELPFGYRSSRLLLPSIERGFEELGIKPKDLTYIAVGVGPGSYTGMRLGAIVAKTLAFACDIPLVGVCSLNGFLPKKECKFAAIVDAKISGAYVLIGEKLGDQATYYSTPEVYILERLKKKLEGITTLVTPHATTLQAKLHIIFPDVTWKWEERPPE